MERLGRTFRSGVALTAVAATVGCTVLLPVVSGPGGEGANGRSFPASISDDGAIISYLSDASNLVAGDTNEARDVFIYNRVTGVTTPRGRRRWTRPHPAPNS